MWAGGECQRPLLNQDLGSKRAEFVKYFIVRREAGTTQRVSNDKRTGL